jgi:RNA polymerase sigma-70 factor, ECF subfamily
VNDAETNLIKRAQENDTAAFCSLAERYARRIYLLAFHYCQNAEDAEDLSQEVWLKAYQALQTFRGDSSFYTWLRKITINSFLNNQRTSGRHGEVAEDSDAEFVASTSEHTIYNKVLFDTVMKALADVTPSQRLIFLLRHYEGMSYNEIASVMGCSTGTAKKAVWRAVAKLRVKLNTADEEREELVDFATEY